jgi:Holliday junction resolvase-like predicted endonuclease
MNLTEEQEIRSAEIFFLTLKAAGITELRQLDERIKAVDNTQLANFQTALTNWLADIKSTSWSTGRFDVARIALLMTASVEVTREILKIAPFNPSLTTKFKQVMGLEDPSGEPDPKAAA